MIPIQPRSLLCANEKLRAIYIWSALAIERIPAQYVFWVKFLSSNFPPYIDSNTSSVTSDEISTLAHEIWDNPVKYRALVVQAFADFQFHFSPVKRQRKFSAVFSVHNHPRSLRFSNHYVEDNFRVRHPPPSIAKVNNKKYMYKKTVF